MFSTGTGTPLYFSKWMPISITAYTGTCVFLIVLAISLRILIAFRSVLEERRINTELNRRYVVRKSNTKERISSDPDSKTALLTENGVEEDVMVVRKQMKGPMPWSIAVDGARAATDTVIAGILYLL
jgi:solute carrier family 31 (copper transporter), member 1